MQEPNLQILPRVDDASSFLYVEHAILERDNTSVTIRQGDSLVRPPLASILALILGPGTSITQAAVSAAAECGTSILWTGEDATRFYASGNGRSRSSAHLLRQVRAWSTDATRMAVVARMYRFRFPEALPANLTLQQLRGREGVRVRDAYAKASRETGVKWLGRNFDRGSWNTADPVNRALSAGAACLYGICHSVIVGLGYSPGVGFIHTGKQLSFVYDVADLYKLDLLVPAAFESAAESEHRVEAAVRSKLREQIRSKRLLERIPKDLHALFDKSLHDNSEVMADHPEAIDSVGEIWDPGGNIVGGQNFADDDA